MNVAKIAVDDCAQVTTFSREKTLKGRLDFEQRHDSAASIQKSCYGVDLGLEPSSSSGRKKTRRQRSPGQSALGMKSQKTKPSRFTTSPRVTSMGDVNIGPADANVWNSPFSAHGSTSLGSSSRKD